MEGLIGVGAVKMGDNHAIKLVEQVSTFDEANKISRTAHRDCKCCVGFVLVVSIKNNHRVYWGYLHM
jgi:predicted methyltransferase